MLEIRNFTKTYKGGKRAVSDLNLHVEAGDIYGFIGHNGAGKSTTIKAAVGVLNLRRARSSLTAGISGSHLWNVSRYWLIFRIILICMSI